MSVGHMFTHISIQSGNVIAVTASKRFGDTTGHAVGNVAIFSNLMDAPKVIMETRLRVEHWKIGM